MTTAKAWGLTPDQWDAESEASRAQMMAYEEVNGKMTAIDHEKAQEEADRQRNMPRAPRRRR